MPVGVNVPGYWNTFDQPINKGERPALPGSPPGAYPDPTLNHPDGMNIRDDYEDVMKNIADAIGRGKAPLNSDPMRPPFTPPDELWNALLDWRRRQR